MTTYDELPQELKTYIEFIEKEVEVPIKVISVGPDRKQTIMK
jgi:adenylosuccinate synthase